MWALGVKVLNTLYLVEMLWWLSQCRYCSVCVGFLYTEVIREPLGQKETSVSKKRNVPCSLGTSVVNGIMYLFVILPWNVKRVLFR